jgi:hypothetical protein
MIDRQRGVAIMLYLHVPSGVSFGNRGVELYSGKGVLSAKFKTLFPNSVFLAVGTPKMRIGKPA